MQKVSVSNETTEDLSGDLQLQFPEEIKVLIIVLVVLLIFLTVFGNMIIMFAFIVDKRLRTQSNFFLLNLAICDFFIGAVAIPLYLPYMTTGKWIFGRFLCKLWLVVDYTMCTASAFNVALISYDRFLCVTMAVLYRSLQKKHSQTVLKMIIVWILSFLLYSPAILLWETIVGKYSPDSVCVAGFYYTWYFLLGASSIGFALPLLSISFFNLSIYWNIKKRSRNRRQSSNQINSEEKLTKLRPYVIATKSFLASSDGEEQTRSSVRMRVKICFHGRKNIGRNILIAYTTANGDQHNDIHIIKLSKDKKVAKSLAILVLVFAFCWAPYTFLMSIRAACQGYCVGSYWYDVTFWLLWINSAINPFLYPLCHKSFRKAFIKVFLQIGLQKYTA